MKVDLACHSWKNAYIALYPEKFEQSGDQFSDVWDQLIKVEPPQYSDESWRKYSPLFKERATYVLNKLERLLSSYPKILPDEFRLLIEKTKDRIEIEQSTYHLIPSWQPPADDKNVFFQVRFQSMIRALTKLSREADRLGQEIN